MFANCAIALRGGIFEAEFLASLHGIYSHLPYSNKVCLIGDNTGVLYCLQ